MLLEKCCGDLRKHRLPLELPCGGGSPCKCRKTHPRPSIGSFGR
jgi:hypothetical protein